MRTAYITHPDCLRHEMGAHHPESPARLQAINDQLIAAGLMELLRPYEAPLASREQICRVHDAAYVDALSTRSPESGRVALDPDTSMNPHSLRAAYRAAGAAVYGVDLVLGGEMECAFCAIRPPGHHAERDRSMGFCLFNNVAVAAAHALAAHGLERVAVVDFDVHHGNGTEQYARGEPRLLFCSSFQHPFYPYTPLDETRPNIVLAPLAAGAYGEQFQAAVQAHWLPALEAFAPELILVSAGFDGHYEDDMAGLNLVESDYAWVTAEIMAVAARHTQGRVVSVLEGGYQLSALGRSAAAHIRGLLGI